MTGRFSIKFYSTLYLKHKASFFKMVSQYSETPSSFPEPYYETGAVSVPEQTSLSADQYFLLTFKSFDKIISLIHAELTCHAKVCNAVLTVTEVNLGYAAVEPCIGKIRI